MRKPGELECLFCFVSEHDFSRAINAQKKCGFRVCVRTPEFGKPEGRTADPSATLRSGRDDNSSWKQYLAFPNKIAIPSVPGFPASPLSLATTYVVLSKENHMQSTDAATLDRKSGEAEGSAVRP